MVGLGSIVVCRRTVSFVEVNYQLTNWWKYLDEAMKDLVEESYLLLEREEKLNENLHDYSFVVFPMAKAYEGFLKKLIFDLGFIKKRQYLGDRFRIGRSLNPSLPKRYQWDWVYDKLAKLCGGDVVPLKMWQAWKNARNKVFHFFPDHHEFVSLPRARELIEEIEGVMELALIQCDRV